MDPRLLKTKRIALLWALATLPALHSPLFESPLFGSEGEVLPPSLCRDVRETLRIPLDGLANLPDGNLPDGNISENPIIGEIEVYTLNIFDASRAGQNGFLFRTANDLHVTTQERVVRQRLLVRPGDPYHPRILQESARHLRDFGIFYDACVEPLRVHGNTVDLLVVTRDVWTLGGGIAFEREGGGNTVQGSLRDKNFLGSGRRVSFKYTTDPDRSERQLRYLDHAVLGSRVLFELNVAERSDGYRRTLDLGRPFFSLDTPWSASTRFVSDKETVRLYSDGEVVERFSHENRFLEVRGGLSKGYGKGGTNRLLFGFTYDADRFLPEDPTSPFYEPFRVSGTNFAAPAEIFPEGRTFGAGRTFGPDPFPQTPVPAILFVIQPLGDPVPEPPAEPVLPPSQTVSYPWVGFERVSDGWVERRNLDQLVRTEDLNLGTDLQFRVGYSSPAWSGDRNQAIFAGSASTGFAAGERHVVLMGAHGSGRFGSESENVLLGGRFRYFLRTFGPHQLLTSVQFDIADNLDPHRQLLIGGDTGLRGYSRRFRDGDRRFLFSLEHRFYTGLELFNLVHVGAAAFFDIGGAWYGTDHSGLPSSELLKDVGVGLRLGSSRSADGTMVHFDVAYPLDGDSRKIQWLVTSRESF